MMDANALYNIAKGFVNKMQHEKPTITEDPEASLCLILTDDDEVFSGVTALGIYNGNVVTYPAECVALIAMFAAGKFHAKQMLILSMKDFSILVPCVEALDMLQLLDTGNDACEVAISAERFATLRQLMEDEVPEEEEAEDIESSAVDYFSGFGDEDVPEEEAASSAAFESGFDASYSAPQHAPVKKEADASLGAPVEFANEVAVDEDNPFYEPPGEADAQDAASSVKNTMAHTEQNTPSEVKQPPKSLSKAELLKQAKKKKKIAKSNFNFFKKKS